MPPYKFVEYRSGREMSIHLTEHYSDDGTYLHVESFARDATHLVMFQCELSPDLGNDRPLIYDCAKFSGAGANRRIYITGPERKHRIYAAKADGGNMMVDMSSEKTFTIGERIALLYSKTEIKEKKPYKTVKCVTFTLRVKSGNTVPWKDICYRVSGASGIKYPLPNYDAGRRSFSVYVPINASVSLSALSSCVTITQSPA
jgi:hypothetical protein